MLTWKSNSIINLKCCTNTQDIVTRTRKSSAKWILSIDGKWLFTVLVYKSDLKFRWWKQMNRKQENFTVGVSLWIVRSRVIWFDILGSRLSKRRVESITLNGKVFEFCFAGCHEQWAWLSNSTKMLSDWEFYQMMQMKLINRLILWL